MRDLGVGLVGCGTVGEGVAEALLSRTKPWRERARPRLIGAADLRWSRSSPVPRAMRTKDYRDLIKNPKVDVVVELIGGTKTAFDCVRAALAAGKDVVTANKALLAERGSGLFRAAAGAGREISFEAAVGGGIPVLLAMRRYFSCDRTRTIHGILNGTTNYILTRMSEDGMRFDEALDEARTKGYAEADPTLDLNGTDSAHKIALLAGLAMGGKVPMKGIRRTGVVGIERADIEYAERLGCVIKLLATAREVSGGLDVSVGPALVPETHLLAHVRNELNAVYIEGDRFGRSLLYGRGAGREATAGAVIADLVELAENRSVGRASGYASRMADIRPVSPPGSSSIKGRFYLRISARDRPGVLSKVAGILAKRRISISSVVQVEGRGGEGVPVVLMTHDAALDGLEKALSEMRRLRDLGDEIIVMRVEE